MIDLEKFNELFDSSKLDFLVISEDGISSNDLMNSSIEHIGLYSRIMLAFPCTERNLFDWAKCLDDWEGHCEELLKHGFVVRLAKDFANKWALDNEVRMAWFFEYGCISNEICRVTNWAHWLTLSEWTKDQAAHLICNIDPHQDKKYSAFNFIIDRMPFIDRQAPIKWAKWFDDNGYLDCAHKVLIDWYDNNADEVEVISMALPTKRTRRDKLSIAIDAAITSMGKKPSFEELWQYFQNDNDDTGIIEDFTDDKITWKDSKGKLQDIERRTLANRLSKIK